MEGPPARDMITIALAVAAIYAGGHGVLCMRQDFVSDRYAATRPFFWLKNKDPTSGLFGADLSPIFF